MAVVNAYVNTELQAGGGGVVEGFRHQGAPLIVMKETFEVAAADDDNSIYRVFKGVNPELIPVKIEIQNDAITAGTDYDLGLYETLDNGGAVINKEVLSATHDMSSAATTSPKNGLGAVDIANGLKALYELAGKAIGAIKGGLDIALTANTVGTAAGTITVTGYFIRKF